MRRGAAILVLAAGAAAIGAVTSGPARAAADGGAPPTLKALREALWGPGRTAGWQPPTSFDRAALGVLVPALFVEAARPEPDPGGLRAAARLVGLELHDWRYAGARYWALLEPPDRVRGRGAYVFRVGVTPPGTRPIVLQAPHAYYDTGTGRLAASLFFRPPDGAPAPVALFAASVPRFAAGGDPDAHREGRKSPSDPCHEPTHGYNAATAAAARALGDVVVLQLHGFTVERLPPADRASTQVIVSSGARDRSAPAAQRTAAALQRTLGPVVRRFPEEIAVLGGSANAQGRLLRRHARADFIHVELSRDLRRRLTRERELRRVVGRALLEAAAGRGD